MAMDRRKFIKLGGLVTLAGVGAASIADVVMGGRAEASSQEGEGGDAPQEGEKRWGMVVDTKSFDTEEKFLRCVEACHTAHNVPDFGNPKDEIKWIWRAPFAHAFAGMGHQYKSEATGDVLVLCNHCQNPPCVRVCPTKATFKRKSDGIVMMDYHRCIGCRFCMAACPFGARSFNWRDPRKFVAKITPAYPTRERGVVEKCNYCEERIAKGKIPACVEASEGGLVFGDLFSPASDVRMALKRSQTVQRRPELGTNPSIFYII